MKLTYFGHCAFRWETPDGVTVMADPYRNQAGRYWFTRLFPDVHCDLGLISHAHFDHDAADRLPGGCLNPADAWGVRSVRLADSRHRGFPLRPV